MKRKVLFLILTGILIMTSSCSNKQNVNPILNSSEEKNNTLPQSLNIKEVKSEEIKESGNTEFLIKNIEDKYKDSIPTVWGEKESGVISSINTKDKIIALTFDACGGEKGNGYDSKLISYLMKENVPATLFINARWIDANPEIFQTLSKNSLFEIENHGYLHKPLSINGKSAYNIRGTSNVHEVINEVYLNEQKIQKLTGKKTKYFRSGTAFYDNVSISILKELGEKPVGFSIIGDAGATFSAEQIKVASLKAKEGSIIIYHMNQPDKHTAEGIIKSIPLLKEKGFKFVKLEDYDEALK
jgi:peptidoglycan/xylan/chitin deacetylase (PgdA/CDA1 family)